MIRIGTLIVMAVPWVLACMPGPVHAQAVELMHDAFAPPALAAMRRLKPEADNAGGASARETTWNPELRAVMVAGRGSMVNVDGLIVRIGEEIQGYRLLEVHDGEAVFIHGEKRRTVIMRGGAQEIGREKP